jgi:uncharacterized protein (DUF433 family)
MVNESSGNCTPVHTTGDSKEVEKQQSRSDLQRSFPCATLVTKDSIMTDPYIEQRNGGYYVAGTRISLDSVVYMFRDGHSPTEIQHDYDALSLPQVYRAIAFYLENKEVVDRNLEDKIEAIKANSIPLKEANPQMWARLEQARQEMRAKE